MSATCSFCDNGRLLDRWIYFDRTPDDRTVVVCPACDGTGLAPGTPTPDTVEDPYECYHPLELWKHETFWDGHKDEDAYYCGPCGAFMQIGRSVVAAKTVTITISREQALYWAAEDNEDGHLPYYSHWAEEMTDGCRAALREDG